MPGEVYKPAVFASSQEENVPYAIQLADHWGCRRNSCPRPCLDSDEAGK